MLIPILMLPVVHLAGGAAALIHESAKAIKDIKEGEASLVAVNPDGTVEMRFLASEAKGAFRFTILKDGKASFDLSGTPEKGTVVDHEGRTVVANWDWKAAFAKAETKKVTDADVAPGNVSVTIDPDEGFVVHANPRLENVKRWRSGDEEMITGDFGEGRGKRGSFQWIRDAKTKYPKSFTGAMDDHKIDIRFTIRPRKVDWSELVIPADAYKGYAPGTMP